MLKILNLLPRIPTPTVDGGAIAVFYNLLNIKQQGVDVVVAAFESNRHPQNLEQTGREFRLYSIPGEFQEYSGLSAFKNLFDSRPYNLALRFDQDRFRELLRKVRVDHNHFDIVQCDWVYMAPYVSLVRELWPGAKVILRQHNAEYKIFERMAEHETSLKNRLFLKLQTAKMKRYEAKALSWFDHIITLTDVDRELFEELERGSSTVRSSSFDEKKSTPQNNIISNNPASSLNKSLHYSDTEQGEIINLQNRPTGDAGEIEQEHYLDSTPVHNNRIVDRYSVLPVGVDLYRFKRDSLTPRKKQFLILGSMSWAPYVQALLWFLNHIWQDFHNVRPEYKLQIVGSNPPDEIRAFNGRFNVEVLGFVEDILPVLHESVAMIVPLKSGSGMRVKIIEAMAAELPIITTSVGCEGIPIQHDRDCLIGNTVEELNDAMVVFTDRSDRGKGLSDNAYKIVREQFSWDTISQKTVDLYRNLVAK